MKRHSPSRDDNRPASGDPMGRRPYAAPQIVWREGIEAMAADCTIPGGKNDATCILGFS